MAAEQRNVTVDCILLRRALATSPLPLLLFLVGCGDTSNVVDASTQPDLLPDGPAAVSLDAAPPLDAGSARDALDPFDPSRVDAGRGGDAPPLKDNVTLHIVGDSTAAIFAATDPRVGWGAVLSSYFGGGVTVHDAAQSGRSSKSFIDEGFWASVKTTIKPGDYVFIEFGHNDEKSGDTARYTIPNTSYRYYLKTYIAETRGLGAFAVLLTSICRRQFSGTTVPDSHAAYTAAVLAVGAETGTPVIDLEAKTNAWLTALGPTAAAAYFAPADATHLNYLGAMAVAGMVAEGIRALGLPIAERLAPPVDAGPAQDAGAGEEAGLDAQVDAGAALDVALDVPPAGVDVGSAIDADIAEAGG
jgi:lysophospholipase L1-like esterase